MNTKTYQWPKPLQALQASAEAGTLEPRELYPLEVKALCDLVAGVPLGESPRLIAPGMTVSCKDECRDNAGVMRHHEKRVAYFFVCRFESGRVWQCSLYTAWQEHDMSPYWSRADKNAWMKAQVLSPANIERALTRSVLPTTAKVYIGEGVQS